MHDLRWPTYNVRDVVLVEAVPEPDHGSVRVRDPDGRVYLDAVGGIGCTPLGHAHPRWADAIARQLHMLSASSNIFRTPPQQELAERLVGSFPIADGRIFLCNSGTEATEAALKLTLRATRRDLVIAFERAFHGRTLGAIALTANPSYRDPYVSCEGEPDSGRFARAGVLRAPYGDLEAVRRLFDRHGKRIAGVFVEPVQGEAGVYVATREFLVGLRELCDRHGALVCADEIQSGCGRTGDMAAWTTIVGDDPELRPDVMSLAKALGGGYPVGACIARKDLAETMVKGSHGTTFGGNPVACVAVNTTLRLIEEQGLLAAARRQIEIVRRLAVERPAPRIKEIRGLGAMIGMEIAARAGEAEPATPLAGALQQRGLLATICVGHTVRWLFPYHAGEQVLGEAWDILRGVLAEA